MFQETGDRHREGGALSNLGEALGEACRFEQAIDAHHDAVAMFQEIGDRYSEG